MSKSDEDAEKGYRETLKGDGKSLKSHRGAKKGDDEAIKGDGEELTSNGKSLTHSSLVV